MFMMKGKTSVDVEKELNDARQIELLQMKTLKILAVIQSHNMPVWLYNDPTYKALQDCINSLTSTIERFESEGYKPEGFDRLQRKAMAKYGNVGLLIEELRDSDNGNLPYCFNAMGNLLARYHDNPEKDEVALLWMLESMKSAIQLDIDRINAQKRDYVEVEKPEVAE